MIWQRGIWTDSVRLKNVVYFENYDFTFYLNSASGGWEAEICNTKTIGEYKSEYIWILELIQIRIIFGLKTYAEYKYENCYSVPTIHIY